jgi:putative transposase
MCEPTSKGEAMATYEVTLPSEQLSGLLTEDKGLQSLVETVLNQVLEAQVTEHLGAQRYERSAERKAYRNGSRLRTLTTRVGPLVLHVPQVRDGSFSPTLFARYQRSEQALILTLMEMVLNGVSTRKVAAVTEELCGTRFSRSTVSQLCMALDARVQAWNERPLGTQAYPFVVVDALVIKVRRDEAVRATSALIVAGVNEQGMREVLGLCLGDSESEATWAEMFAWLKKRGLRGVEVLVSDDHGGLVKAAQRYFQGVIWQRCQVHLQRNVLGRTPRHLRAQMAAGLRRIFQAVDVPTARAAFLALAATRAGKADRALTVLEEGLEDALAVLVLPEKYRLRLRTTNGQERLNEEVRRRERVIRIFPNEAAAVRMIGALLAEQHEVWSTGKRYFDMTEYFEWHATRAQEVSRELRRIG